GRRRGREVAYGLTDTHVAHIVGDAVAHASEPPG
ncbi:MAG: transcriptional regulator, partial [Acidimicrobiales bacterium]|nr:transcriptional regulator [Acidimicrobiales bacterium]